jgi:multidrug efflux pump subunit AcrA (membrane-fusion protein)
MNRSILIVICDFLLISLLAFSTVDINKVTDQKAQRPLKLELATNQAPDAGKDLAAVMRLALDEERKGRSQLVGELAHAREEMGKQQAMLGEREKQVQTFQQEIQSREEQAQKLQQEQTNLQQQYATAQANLQSLNQQLQSSSAESVLSKEKLAAMEAELKKKLDDSTALQQQLAQLARSNQNVLGEKQQLATQLQVAEAEKRSATEQVARMQDEVKAERAEKTKLAEGVKALASKSGELAQEVRENRPLASNTIYNQFVTNRLDARFNAFRPGIIGADKRRETQTVLVSDGKNTFALSHVQDTPLTLWNPGTDWEALTGTLAHNMATVPIRSLSFQLQDPRVVLMPVTAAQARELGCMVYPISPDPFKFQDAVLVGTRENYYGECKFEIDVSTPDYLKIDRNVLKGLFGKFNPSKGDLVFSRTGQLLGIMVNSTYCMMIRNFDPAATLQFGQDVRQQRTGGTLAALYAQVSQLPAKLQ